MVEGERERWGIMGLFVFPGRGWWDWRESDALVLVVGGSLFSLDFFFVSLTLCSFLVFSLSFGCKGRKSIYDDIEIWEVEEYTTILRFGKGILR